MKEERFKLKENPKKWVPHRDPVECSGLLTRLRPTHWSYRLTVLRNDVSDTDFNSLNWVTGNIHQSEQSSNLISFSKQPAAARPKGGQHDKLWKKFETISNQNLSFYNGNHANFWIFGGVNKHLFRKVKLIIRAQFLLCRLHNNDNLKLYESFHRQTLLYYSFFTER